MNEVEKVLRQNSKESQNNGPIGQEERTQQQNLVAASCHVTLYHDSAVDRGRPRNVVTTV
jgi:hypothetical protein